jgi:hypothetical protein
VSGCTASVGIITKDKIYVVSTLDSVRCVYNGQRLSILGQLR